MSRHFVLFLILFLNPGAGNELFSRSFAFSPGPLPDREAASPTPQGASPEARGRWVADRVDARETGRDSRVTLRMRLYDRQNRARERALTITGLRGGPNRPTPGDRSLIRFTYPNDIKGTGFLVWEHPDREDERFLYLPALGRTRRIAGAEAQESFVGSDFTYEDIGGRELDDYTYRLLEDRPSTWQGPDGVSHAVNHLESRSRDAGAKYPRVTSIVRRDNFVVVQAEVHNRRDEVQKRFDALRVERTGGYWTVLEMRMTDALQRTRTELVVEKAEYDVGLTADAFSRRELERGAPPAPVVLSAVSSSRP
jgi:hypothetical protein